MNNKQQQPKKESNLRIQSSVYPEGWGNQTPEQYNATWQHIFSESAKTLNDPRQYKDEMHKAFSIN